MSTGRRIREERERLGLTQDDFASLAGVTRYAQIKYEKGERHPDARYLSAIAKAGADVLYILTGERSSAPALSREEAALLDNYRHAPPEGKQALQTMGAALAEQGRPQKAGGGAK